MAWTCWNYASGGAECLSYPYCDMYIFLMSQTDIASLVIIYVYLYVFI